MLKTLIILRLKGIFLNQTKSDKKNHATIGKAVLMIVLFGYVGVVFLGMFTALFYTLIDPLYSMNIEWLYFAIMAFLIISLCFIGSIFYTHHEIYEAKDNELLLSLPIRSRDILLSRVFTILIINYVYELIVALPAFAVYVYKIGMDIVQIIMFIIVIATLPLFVLALSCLFSWFLAHVLSKLRNKNMITLIFSGAFFGLYFYFINSAETYMIWLLQNSTSIAETIKKSVFPLYHLSMCIYSSDIISLMIYLLCIFIPFGIIIYLLSTNFIKLATTKAKQKKKEYKQKTLKAESIKKALILRELKHFTSNAMVMMNTAIGIVFCIIGSIALIIYYKDIAMTISLIPEINEYLSAILTVFVTSAGSLNMISASSISLEGDRFWILKTLPIDTKEILDSKLLLHALICVPPVLLLSAVSSLLFKLSFIDSAFVIIIPILLIMFVDLFGLTFNLWKPKFDWVNETVCVKQSLSPTITMFISMGLSVIMVMVYILCMKIISISIYMWLILIVFLTIDIFLYNLLKTWGVKRFQEL